MDSGKGQKFPYSYKTISIPVNSQYSFNKPRLEILNPQNIYETELLFTHIRILFDSTIDPIYKKLLRVTVTGLDADGYTVRAAKGVELNKSAVANVIDVKLDLTPFIYKTGRNLITFEVPAFGSVDSSGTGGITGTNILQIWKADMAYTVKGVA